MMQRKKVDVLCVQRTRRKYSKARSIGVGSKHYYLVDRMRNGEGVILREEYTKNVVEAKRMLDMIMIVKLKKVW